MNSNRNRQYPPRAAEETSVIKSGHQGARDGGFIGGATAAGTASLFLKKKKLLGSAVAGAVGTLAGAEAGRRIGVNRGARDVKAAQRALRQGNQLAALVADVQALAARADQRDFDRNGNSGFPGESGQHPTRIYPKVRRKSEPGLGVDDQGMYELTEERQRLGELFGRGIVDALADEDLSEENCRRLHDEVLRRQSKAAGPHASTQSDPEFERHFLASKIGDKAVSEMPDTLVHCNFLAAVRRGDLVEFGYSPDTTDFAIINRERTAEGTFAPTDATNPAAVARAYGPDRRTGRTPETVGALGAAAGLAGALAHLAGKKGRRPRLPLGVPRLTAGSSTNPATAFAMTSAPGPGTFPIRRAKLRGKKPPTNVHPRHLGKVKPKNFAFLIADNDPAFRLDPVKPTRLVPGTKQRVPMAKTRSEVLRRLRGMTQLSIGSAVAEGALDAVGLVGATPGKKKKLTVDSRGNVLAPPQRLTDPGTTSTSSFASAIRRLHEFGLGSSVAQGAARFAPEVAAIGIGDVLGETAHDRLKAAQDKKRRRLIRQRGGVEPLPGMGTAAGTMTTMRAVHSTIMEFDTDGKRDAARRHAAALGASGLGAVAGAYGALASHRPGRPAHPGEDLQGKRVFVKRKSVIPSFHVGVGGENGVVHRSPGRGNFREVKRDTFRRNGTGGLRVEDVVNGKTPRANACAASAAAGTKAGRYGIGQNNCEHGVDRILGGRGASHQVRRGVAGLVGGAVLGGTMAEILNRKKVK